MCLLSIFFFSNRYMGIGRQGLDLHMFNVLAVENRVNTFHLPDDAPISTVEDIQFSQLLPDREDNEVLTTNWCTLTAHVLTHYLPKLEFLRSHVPKAIPHKYMAETRRKTTVVSAIFTVRFQFAKLNFNIILTLFEPLFNSSLEAFK